MSKEMFGSGLELVLMRYVFIVFQNSYCHELQKSATILSGLDSRDCILVLSQGFIDML